MRELNVRRLRVSVATFSVLTLLVALAVVAAAPRTLKDQIRAVVVGTSGSGNAGGSFQLRVEGAEFEFGWNSKTKFVGSPSWDAGTVWIITYTEEEIDGYTSRDLVKVEATNERIPEPGDVGAATSTRRAGGGANFELLTWKELAASLSPTYIRSLPKGDGWGAPLEFRVEPNGQHYSIVSTGADNRRDRVEAIGPGRDPATDLIFSDGAFITYHAGTDDAARQSIASIRAVATAWEAYATDYNTYMPKREQSQPDERSKALRWSELHTISYEDLSSLLAPTYIRRLPERDGWGRDFEFGVGEISGGEAMSYSVRSRGSDGKAESSYADGAKDVSGSDIVFQLGRFYSFPGDGVENAGALKRTMADIRSIATAWEAYAVDNNLYWTVPSGK